MNFNKASKKRYSGGFTLVELLIAASILTLLSGLLLMVMVNNQSLLFFESSKVNQGLEFNDTLVVIRNSIKESQAVVSGYPTTPPYTHTSNSSQLVLQLGSIDSQGEIITGAYDYVFFYLLQKFLYKKIIPDPVSTRGALDTIIANEVESINFEYLDGLGASVPVIDADKIRFTLTLSSSQGRNKQTGVATSEANLIND